MAECYSISHLINQLSTNCTVITVNQRLAALISQAYDTQQQQLGLMTWPRCTILPSNTWLLNQWQALCQPVQILNSIQELALWKKIISEHSIDLPLINIEQTSQLMQQAWHLFNHWQLDLAQLKAYHNQQIDCFTKWSDHFQDLTKTNQWLSLAELPLGLINHWQKSVPQLTPQIYWVGFDEISPLQHHLINHMSQYCELTVVDILGTEATCQRIELENQSQEITIFTAWAAELLRKNPDIKIGCIVPNLSNCRETIVNELANTFAIQNKLSAYIDFAHHEFIYNISASQYLSEFEAIYIALQIIQLLSGQFDLETIGLILQSPYLMHDATDIDFGALLDHSLRENNYLPQLPLENLLFHINKLEKSSSKQTKFNNFKNSCHWRQRWQQFYKNLQLQTEYHLPSQWAQYFELQLRTVGWPGCRQRNSLEFQLMQRWQQLLGEMAYLDSIYPSITLNEAIHYLNNLAKQTPFQAQGNPQAPIQILGILESIGYQFDAVWIMGLDDENWPPPANPNPFLPFQLQQQLNMPHASAVRQLNYTREITRRLLQSAPNIILSYCGSDGEKVLRPSKLIEHFPLYTLDNLSLTKTNAYPELIYAAKQLETIYDQTAPPMGALESPLGGSTILTEQALCPFRAFALKRLQAQSLPKINIAISSKHRGILLHHAMAQLWVHLQNQQNLLQLTSEEINTLIEQTIESAFLNLFNSQQIMMLRPLLNIEKLCLHKLIFQWLIIEKQRSPFKVIACEYQTVINIGPLKLTIRIDRMDELNDGNRIIIDYKTSSNQTLSTQAWLNQPLEQLQLPLYSLMNHNSSDYSQNNNINNNHHNLISSTPELSLSGASSFYENAPLENNNTTVLQTENKTTVFTSLNSSYSVICYAQIRADNMQFRGICSEKLSNPLGNLAGVTPIHEIKNKNKHQFSQWETLQHHWQNELTALAQDFYNGKAHIEPLHDKQTCQTCELQNLCRYS